MTGTEEQLSAYIDGELAPAERAEVDRWLAQDARARALVAELTLLRGAVEASLDAEAAKVPEARFEQIWDEIDRALDRETAAHPQAAPTPSLWARVLAVLRPVWVPVAATAAVAAVVVGIVSSGAITRTSGPTAVVASNDGASAPVPADSPAATPAELEPVFPAPALREADIERIEFGGKAGRIGTIEGTKGTTTVIWISEDEPPAGRSL
ncbi:MAG: zf-HC2 domain-containing protein [Myxococcales bacterium]|nr:zf-HC2 domain-containing protein [Myxococcales bacterium]